MTQPVALPLSSWALCPEPAPDLIRGSIPPLAPGDCGKMDSGGESRNEERTTPSIRGIVRA
jgi:hypothetical protein